MLIEVELSSSDDESEMKSDPKDPNQEEPSLESRVHLLGETSRQYVVRRKHHRKIKPRRMLKRRINDSNEVLNGAGTEASVKKEDGKVTGQWTAGHSNSDSID